MAASTVFAIYRFNEQGGTYEQFTNLLYYGDECIVMGLISFNLARRQELFTHLRQQGIKWLRYTHKGRKKIIYLGAD